MVPSCSEIRRKADLPGEEKVILSILKPDPAFAYKRSISPRFCSLVIYDADTDTFSDQVTRDELDALREKENARVKDDVTAEENAGKNGAKTAAGNRQGYPLLCHEDFKTLQYRDAYSR